MLNNQRDPSLRCNRFVISRHTLETIYELGWCAAGNTLTEIIILVRCSQTWINHFGGQTKIASLSLSPPVSIFIYIYIIERIKIGLDYWTGLDWITYIYIEIIHKIGLALDIHTHTLEGSGQPDSSQEERHGEFQQSPLPPLASRFAAARSVASSAARAGRAGT